MELQDNASNRCSSQRRDIPVTSGLSSTACAGTRGARHTVTWTSPIKIPPYTLLPKNSRGVKGKKRNQVRDLKSRNGGDSNHHGIGQEMDRRTQASCRRVSLADGNWELDCLQLVAAEHEA